MRPTLISALVGLFTAGGIGAGALWWTSGFDPSTCSDQWLWIWMVRNDVSQLPASQRNALIIRLEHEILGGIDMPSTSRSLSERQLRQLNANIDTLQHDWFASSVAAYSNAPGSNAKLQLIDRKLGVLMNWPETAAVDGEPPITAQLFGKINGWIAAADVPQQDQMNRAVQASVERWLAKYDLKQQPASVQEELTVRIADELNNGLKLNPIDDGDETSHQFRDNALLLMQTWFRLQAAEYAACAVDQRQQLVDRRLDELFSWNVGAIMESDAAPNDSMAHVLRHVQHWISAAPSDQRALMQEYATAAQRRLLMRLFTGDGQKK